MHNLCIEDKHLKELTQIFKSICPKAVIWAFGSRVNGSAHSGSDLDLTIVDYGQTEPNLQELQKAVKDSNIPFLIDILEMNTLSESFQQEIKRNYLVIYNGANKL